MTLFAMSTTVGWANLMYHGIATTEIDYSPKQHNNFNYSLYFMSFIVVGAFFMLNLFVGVVISTYNREKERIGSN